MNCLNVEEQMAAFVVGDTSPQLTVQINEHLAECASCRAWHDEVGEMLELWTVLEPVEGLNFVDPVLNKISTKAPDAPVSKRTLELRPLFKNTLVHYGVAASFTLALFQFRVFERFSFGLSQHGIAVARQLHGLMHVLSSL